MMRKFSSRIQRYGRRADRVRRDVLLHRRQLTEFERVVVRDRVADEARRQSGHGNMAAASPSSSASGNARRLILPVVVTTVPDMLLDDAIGVLAGVVADVTIPGPVVPDQTCGQVRGH